MSAGDRSVADLLAATRADLGLSLAAFATLLSQTGGTVISRQRLSALEKGRPLPSSLLRTIAEVCASLDGLANELHEAWFLRLRNPEVMEPLHSTSTRREGMVALTVAADSNLRWPLYRELAARAGMDLNANLAEARRYLSLTPPHETHWTAEPSDTLPIVAADSTLAVTTDHGELFLLVATLRNTGAVRWQNRLLVRLGPVVASSLAYTPPILSVPDTPQGSTCSLAIPGRAPWFPNLTTVAYAMVFPDGRPALGGALHLSVDARLQIATSHVIPTDVETQFEN